jgi:hypothetical protein
VDAFQGLAQEMVAAGVPAVIAMQGIVTAETAHHVASEFYRQLMEHGEVDTAMNQARGTLLTEGRPDAEAPVLFMRLESGLLWEMQLDEKVRRYVDALAKLPASRFGERLIRPFLGRTDKQSTLHDRCSMLKRVEEIWITGVLDRSLHRKVLADLGKGAQMTTADHSWNTVLRTELGERVQSSYNRPSLSRINSTGTAASHRPAVSSVLRASFIARSTTPSRSKPWYKAAVSRRAVSTLTEACMATTAGTPARTSLGFNSTKALLEERAALWHAER